MDPAEKNPLDQPTDHSSLDPPTGPTQTTGLDAGLTPTMLAGTKVCLSHGLLGACLLPASHTTLLLGSTAHTGTDAPILTPPLALLTAGTK